MCAFGGDWQRFLPQSDDVDGRSEFSGGMAGQTVCVAGAAGDIGSALVRALQPEQLRRLILLDSSEHGLFELRRGLEQRYPRAACEYVLGSVDDLALLASAFARFRPQTVFHAAAFKHVGLLEENPFAAMQNNVIGTYRLLAAALRHEVSTFVLLSTDKAVCPHSVMGVSKRLAELFTLSLSGPKFRASAVRLGNVIGSRGSVVPIFSQQIQKGGPVFVTHSQASRYFLSKREAVEAILAAGVAACDGAILLPQFKSPVVIAELAQYLIEAYDGVGSVAVCFQGLRPGEKLHEDLIGPEEKQAGTASGPLTVVQSRKLTVQACEEAVEALAAVLRRRDGQGLLALLQQLVPQYLPSRLLQESFGMVSC